MGKPYEDISLGMCSCQAPPISIDGDNLGGFKQFDESGAKYWGLVVKGEYEIEGLVVCWL